MVMSAPGAAAPSVPQLSPALHGIALAPSLFDAPGVAHRPFTASRGPPPLAPIHRA